MGNFGFEISEPGLEGMIWRGVYGIFAEAFAGADFVEETTAFLEKRAPRFGPRRD